MTPLTPATVTALAQQTAESPAHLDPVLVQQVCQEWETMRERLYWFEKAGGVAMATRVHTIMNERDAALAERDALKKEARRTQHEYAREMGFTNAYIKRCHALTAQLTEARRVLREVQMPPGLDDPIIWAGVPPDWFTRRDAVLAQEEQS